jgi:MFS family permease
MPDASTSASRILLRHRPYRAYFLAQSFAEFAYQIAVVAVGWQVYSLTHSALALGLVGLVQFIPTLLLTFVAGHAADRYDRVRLVQVCQITQALVAGFLAWGSFAGWITAHEIFAAVAIFGTAIAFESPASAALLTASAPEGLLQKGAAVATGGFQLARISGPAIGGFAYAVSPGAPYAMMTGLWLLAGILFGMMQLARTETVKEPVTLKGLFAGVGFVRGSPAILGTISLDLFAVLFGGATALLPIYASDILHTGPWGLGILRGAPAAGALLMTVVLARHAIKRRVGMRMLQAVLVFGFATVVFALSRMMWLSLIALAIMGAADTISVVIRVSLVQLTTPDALRGRVGALNYLFINASNQLGEFESGTTAALLGAMPAAVVGGIATIAIALAWMKFFPALRKVETLE